MQDNHVKLPNLKAADAQPASNILLTLFIAAGASMAAAQDYPNKPIRVIVPLAAGGQTDVVARLLTQKLAESFRQPLVVDNRSGGGGAVGTETAVRSNPDGYTMLVAASSYAALAGKTFDVVINATSAGLTNSMPELPDNLFMPGALAYDMVYGKATPFMQYAAAQGARVADGLGMLVEQAAESFFIWRGVRPSTAPVIAALRQSA